VKSKESQQAHRLGDSRLYYGRRRGLPGPGSFVSLKCNSTLDQQWKQFCPKLVGPVVNDEYRSVVGSPVANSFDR
jgi:hypothetical protein